MENIICLQLLRAGYQVYTGSIKEKEVDFVAIKADRTIYVQSVYMLLEEETIRREYAALEAINDNYEKIVVSMDDIPRRSLNGIKHIQAWKLSEIL